MKSAYVASLLALLCSAACHNTSTRKNASAERRFHFEYETTISGFPTDAKQVRVWLPIPTSDETQSVTHLTLDAPVSHRMGTEKVYGNRLVYLEVDAPFPKELPVTLSMNVSRKELNSVAQLAGSAPRDRLLVGDTLAPLSNEARSRATRATRGVSGSQAQARAIYDRVLADVNYDKSGKGWGRGHLEYVCEAGKGNCSDFHTLFIAMARSKKIPSVFEIGFPLPAGKQEGSVSGYHCWAWFQDGRDRWRPVDASEADKDPSKTDYFFGTICENRIAFSRGRDLILDPPQSGDPVNFLIYPYVEVDGRPDVAKVEKEFRFKNL